MTAISGTETNSKTILVIGETGSGKSSLINAALGHSVAKTSGAAVGCTFQATAYLDPRTNNIFYDTVGLNEPAKGTVSAKEAMRSLIQLLKSLESGINLIIFVIRKGRITETMTKNYTIFAQGLCARKVPVILAISGCESDADPNSWYNENQQHFENNGMKFDAVICGCFSDDVENLKPSMKAVILESFAETKKELITVLKNTKYDYAHKFGTWFSWLKNAIAAVWNAFANQYGFNLLCMWNELRDAIMETMSLDQREATELANDIAQTIQK